MDAEQRRHRERQATLLFVGTSLVTAVTIGAMRISGWSGGRLDNRIEPLFWAGAIIAAAAIALFALAAMPRDRADVGVALRRMSRLVSVGLVLFVAGPVLAVIAVFADYWI